MIEIPEARTLAKQINETLKGKKIISLEVNQSPHKFAWMSGDQTFYEKMLCSHEILETTSYGGYVEMKTNGTSLYLTDGVNVRYYNRNEKVPTKHQLRLNFNDESSLTCSVQMYGGIWCEFNGQFANPYFLTAKTKINPLSEEFTYAYFNNLEKDEKQSIKAMLATNQKIPGIGNGVLQDILFNASLHPRRKVGTITEKEWQKLYESIRNTLKQMTDLNGRDTEKDLFGQPGGYKTILSKNTVDKPCLSCSGVIKKEAYLGGSIYYCPNCQI